MKLFRHTHDDDPNNAELTSIEARLAAVEDRPDPSRNPADLPQVTPNPAAIDCYASLGQADAAQPGADQHTSPQGLTQPSADLVDRWAHAPLDKLGLEYQQTKQAFAHQTLGQVEPEEIRARHILPKVLGLLGVLFALAGAGIVVEIVYGQHAAALLSGDYPEVALGAAIAFALAINSSAFVAGGWLHATSPSIVRRHGVRIICITAVLIGIVAATLGLVVGNYDQVTSTTATGGGSSTVTTAVATGRPLPAIAYFTIVVLISTALAAGHLLFADAWDTHKVKAIKDAQARAEAASLSPWQQGESMATLCQTFLDCIPAAHMQGRRRVASYNSNFRRTAAPAIAEMFDDVAYHDAEPAFSDDARALLEELNTADARRAKLTLVAS